MKDYRSSHAVPYERPSRIGFTAIDVLPFLVGRKWDEHALAFVHTLRPSSIRVTDGEEKSDTYRWRVTVHIDKDETIQSIVQEVEVGLVPEWQYGADADAWMRGYHVTLATRYREPFAMHISVEPESFATLHVREPKSIIDWSKYSPHEILRALESAPTKIGGPWVEHVDGVVIRHRRQSRVVHHEKELIAEVWYYTDDRAGHVMCVVVNQCPLEQHCASVEDGKAQVDAVLRKDGWLLDDDGTR
jgi:hypothetical protein